MVESSLFNKIFCDSEGNVVLAQPPNLPLLVWIGATLLKVIFTDGSFNIILDIIAFGSLLTWAWQELFEGVNYFRRALGLIVLIWAIASKIQGF
jgi:hypothetical protein